MTQIPTQMMYKADPMYLVDNDTGSEHPFTRHFPSIFVLASNSNCSSKAMTFSASLPSSKLVLYLAQWSYPWFLLQSPHLHLHPKLNLHQLHPLHLCSARLYSWMKHFQTFNVSWYLLAEKHIWQKYISPTDLWNNILTLDNVWYYRWKKNRLHKIYAHHIFCLVFC